MLMAVNFTQQKGDKVYLHEAIKKYQEGGYKGFKVPWMNIDYFICKDDEIHLVHEKNIVDTNFGIEGLIRDDYIMIEEEKVPEGFVIDYLGNYYKACIQDVYYAIFWDVKKQKEFVVIRKTVGEIEDVIACFKSRYKIFKYIKTCHMSQQYSIKLSDING